MYLSWFVLELICSFYFQTRLRRVSGIPYRIHAKWWKKVCMGPLLHKAILARYSLFRYKAMTKEQDVWFFFLLLSNLLAVAIILLKSLLNVVFLPVGVVSLSKKKVCYLNPEIVAWAEPSAYIGLSTFLDSPI